MRITLFAVINLETYERVFVSCKRSECEAELAKLDNTKFTIGHKSYNV